MKSGGSLITARRVFVCLGILLLCLLVWVLGPYLGFGNAQPFASILGRVIATLVILLSALGIWLFGRWRRGRKDSQLAGELSGGEGASRASAERDELGQRFSEAVAALKENQGRKSLYQLPWYAIVGPPGAGKSTLLQNSGLDFPLAGLFGREAVRGVGGTRSCDWWFTSEAVFLDTAGRFTTQDSDSRADKAAWSEFLNLLVKYRPRQPLNGVIVAVSALDLMTLDDARFGEMASAVRQRIEELQRETAARVPVYIVFTKMDLVAGFIEFFDDLNRDQRAQVWGATFGAEDSFSGQAVAKFDAEFALLMERIEQRWLERVQRENDERRRASLFAFPSQLRGLRDGTRRFIEMALKSGGFGRGIMLRGVYFTSGTQEGTPIDRMLGALGRAFGIDVSDPGGATRQVRTFFVERLLRDVLIPESGIAGMQPRAVTRRRLIQAGSYALVGVVGLLLLVALATSYKRNRAYLGEVAAAIDEVPLQHEAGTPALRHIANQLGGLASTVDVASRGGESAPLSMRWGLLQVPPTREAAEGAYQRALSSQLMPIFAVHLRDRILETTSEPGALYEYLRAYLMLAEPKRLEAEFMLALGDIEWRRIVPRDKALRGELQQHFARLIERKDGFPPIIADERTVRAARQTLLRASLEQLAYGRLQGMYANQNWPPLNLDEAMGLGASDIFMRRSGIGLAEEPIPALYTQQVFQSVVADGAEEVVRELVRDSWVFGEEEKRVPAEAHLVQRTLALYERDYIAQWEVLLEDLELRPTGNLPALQEQLYLLTSGASPLRAMLAVVTENTKIELPKEEEAAVGLDAGALKDRVVQQARSRSRLGNILAVRDGAGGGDEVEPGASITEHFKPFHKLMAGAPGAAPLDAILRLLTTYRDRLNVMGGGAGGSLASQLQTGASDVVGAVQAEAGRWPPPMSTWLQQLVGQGSTLTAGRARSQMAKALEAEVGLAARAACKGRYPFQPDARQSIPMLDFARLFGHGGVYDKFLSGELGQLIDTSGTRWKWRPGPGGEAPGSAAELRQIQAAAGIRDAFFPAGASRPELAFVIHLSSADIGRLMLVMGEYRVALGPDANSRAELQWPAGAVGGFAMQASYLDGKTERLVWQGPWALFRALSEARTEVLEDGSLGVVFEVPGRSIELRIEPAGLRNPFTEDVLGEYRCG